MDEDSFSEESSPVNPYESRSFSINHSSKNEDHSSYISSENEEEAHSLFENSDTKSDQGKKQKKALEKDKIVYEYQINDLTLGSLIYNYQSKIVYKVTQVVKDINSPFIIIKDRKQEDDIEANIKVTLDTFYDYSIFRDIKIVYVNFLNKTLELLYPANINSDFASLIDSFKWTYQIPMNSLEVVYKGEKVQDLTIRKFCSFDFEEDYILLVETPDDDKECFLNGKKVTSSSSSFESYDVLIALRHIKLEQFVFDCLKGGIAYFEIYKTSIPLNEKILDESESNKHKYGERILKSDWKAKARLEYSLPLTKTINANELSVYPICQNVLLQANTIYIIKSRIDLLKEKYFYLQKSSCWTEEEMLIINENKKICFKKIKIKKISDLALININ